MSHGSKASVELSDILRKSEKAGTIQCAYSSAPILAKLVQEIFRQENGF